MNLCERFWSKVTIIAPDKCWLWCAGKDKLGYGRFGMGDVLFLSHRVAWELQFGPIPDGLCVLHKCDNPRCVNPTHLFLGTRSDNYADMVKKGRRKLGQMPVGEKHWKSKLREFDILKIVKMYRDGTPAKRIAEYFDVSDTHVYRILKGNTWSHVARKPTEMRFQEPKKVKHEIRNQVMAFVGLGNSQVSAAKRFGLCRETISKILKHRY